MNSSSSTSTTTITWYAFTDSKSGREYFIEPKSGETSWVLPTSSAIVVDGTETLARGSITPRNNTVATVKTDEPSNHLHDISSSSPRTNTQPRPGRNAVGVIAFVIVINTLLLLVLTFNYAVNNNRLPINQNNIHTKEAQVLPENYVELQVVSPNNDRVAIDDDMYFPTVPVVPNNDDNFAIMEADAHQINDNTQSNNNNADINVGNNQSMDNLTDKASVVMKETGCKLKENNVDINKSQTNLPTNEMPLTCWIPFSYIFKRNCRAREGLRMPLADADNDLWI